MIDGKPVTRLLHLCWVALLVLMVSMPATSRAQSQQAKPAGTEPIPEPAIPAILAAFHKYEVVAMPVAHGMKDMDDFILSLIRNPAFPENVNDIAVECGNSLYQPILDRYIAGENVPFPEVQKVWRNTTQPMCGMSAFFERFFPLVRAINQKLPPAKRLRVLAGDPPIDWNVVKNRQDIFKVSRDANIASLMEREILSRHRKALMLFGNFHLFHGGGIGPGNAVTIYGKSYPGVTFVISDLGYFNTNVFANWPIPSLVRIKNTWLGNLDLTHFFPPTIWTDDACNVHNEFRKNERKPAENLIDAFLYLGPQDLRLKEQTPADIALDVDYMTELLRREKIAGIPGAATLKDFDQQIISDAENPLLIIPKAPDLKIYFPFIKQTCLANRQHRDSKPQ